MGVRERKKQIIRQSIIDNARDSFLSRGYADTTLDEIAEKADIGVGTLYNYYHSKADLFLEVMKDELAGGEEVAAFAVATSEDDLLDLLLKQIWSMEKTLTIVSKDMWCEIVSVALATMNNKNTLLERLMKLDINLINRIQQFFDYQKENGFLAEDFPSEQAAYAIYSIAITQFMLYIYNDIGLEDIKAIIESQVRFVFSDKGFKG